MSKFVFEGNRSRAKNLKKTQDSRLNISSLPSGNPSPGVLRSAQFIHLASCVFLVFCVLCLASTFSYSPETNLRASDIATGEVSRKSVWVFFADKETLGSPNTGKRGGILALGDPRIQYPVSRPLRASTRRQRAQGRAMDISDLPVSQSYIDGVLRLGATLRVASRWLNGITVEVPDSVMPQILKLPYVKSIEPIVTYRRQRYERRASNKGRNAPGRGDTGTLGSAEHEDSDSEKTRGTNPVAGKYGMSVTQIQQIRVDVLHDKGYHGEGITIALLDTGFDLSHEALRDVHVLAQYDFVNGDRDTFDNPPADDIGQDDHGTEVLSIIAGSSPGNLIGVAHGAQYLLAKTERVSQKGTMFEQEIEEDWWIAGLEWAELNGADIVSSSLGYSDWYSYSDMDGATAKTTIAANIAIGKGMVVVVSAGNEGKSRDWPYISAPADGFHVIAVGAVDSSGQLADFSSIGPTYDGRIKPDVVAMGDDTYAVDPNSTSGYRRADGTSMATPLVAGTAALLLQALPGLDRPRELAKLLKYTATRALSPDNRWGWGVINAEAALRYGISPHLMEELSNWDPTGATSDSHSVILYPNPVRRGSSANRLSIHSPEPMDNIRIFSISGVLVYERQDMGSARFSIWDLKNEHGQAVASGIYICVIKDSNGGIHLRKLAIID